MASSQMEGVASTAFVGTKMESVETATMALAKTSSSSNSKRGYCDSYFVEEESETSLFARRAAERERTRALNRERQRELAENLSALTADEYEEDILVHMEHMERETLPDVNSIDIQTEIQWFMRPYLLDFLIEVHSAFMLLPETLSLAINLLDRYCSKRVVYKKHYQLVGCTTLLIAAKYGDRKERVPTIRELKSMCCSLYEEDMFTQMEWHVLQTLGWAIGHPTVPSFLQIILSEVTHDPEMEHLTWYISELALYHKDFVSVPPSILARSAVALARVILNRADHHFSDWARQYDYNVVIRLHNKLSAPSEVVSRKYATNHLSRISATVEDFLRRAYDNSLHVPAHPGYSSWHVPTTPAKGGFAPSGHMPDDVITPPITPDKDPFFYSANGPHAPPPSSSHSVFAPHQQHSISSSLLSLPTSAATQDVRALGYFPAISQEA